MRKNGSLNKFCAKLWGFAVICGVIFLTLHSQTLKADGSSASTVSSTCQNAAGQSQQGQYCSSAQSSSQGSDADSALYKVWGGVATVCTSACVNSYAVAPNPALQAHCKWDNRAGAGTDAVVSKNYSSALQSIAASEGSSEAQKLMTKNGSNSSSNSSSSSTNGNSPKATKRGDSCITAVSATGTALSKYKSMKSEDQTTQSSVAAAQSLSNTTGNAATTAVGGPSLSVHGGQQSGATAGTVGSANGANSGSNPTASVCANARSTGSVAATIQCAVASDPSLPSYVATPQFLSDFKAASGSDFSNFGSNPDQSAADAISQAAAGTLSSSTASQVAGVIRGLDDHAVAYSGNSGGPAHEEAAAPDEATAMVEMMKNMIAQTGAQAGAKTSGNLSGVEAVIFANQNRAPASIPEDKTLNIFDRITYRYYFVNKQMENSR